MSIWDAVTETVDSLGDAVIAVPGVVWDSAAMAFDGDFSFGTWVDKASGRANDMLDPLLNPDTITGSAVLPVMQGLEWTYREGISEPIVTATTMFGHVANSPVENWDDVFDGSKWGDAYETAQTRSIGQAALLAQGNYYNTLAGGAFGEALDPMDKRAYQQIHQSSPFATSMITGGTDFAARWYLDPGVLIGKTAKYAKQATQGGKLGYGEQVAGIKRVLDGEVMAAHGFTPFMRGLKTKTGNDTASRYNKLFDWMDTGANGAPLNSTQMFVGIPEIRQAAGGRQIAGLLERASKIENPALRRDQYRSIFAVAHGDLDEIGRLQGELGEFSHIADELKNLAKGNVVDLKTTALGHEILANPVLHSHLQGQLDRLPQVKNAVENHVRRLELLVGRKPLDEAADEVTDTGIQGVMKEAGGVSRKGKRAVGRDMGKGLLKDGNLNTGRDGLDNFAAARAEQVQRLAKHKTMQTVFQHSPSSVPARVITNIAGLSSRAALGYARAPQKFTDALRRQHMTGYVNLHDWDGASNQLDTMLQNSGVEHGKRWALMGEAALMRTEGERQGLIERVEHESILALAEKHNIIPKAKAAADEAGEKYTSQYLRDFVSEVVNRGSKKRAVHMAPRSGRVYASTVYGDPVRGQAQNTLRADQKITDIDEDGIPNIIANPLLETQLANTVPLVDTDRIDQVLKRENGRLKSHAKAWANLRYEADRLNHAKRTTGALVDKSLEGIYKGMDMLADAASAGLRVWKYSVLFRLGYPLRILLDDHARIYSQIGAAAMLSPLKGEVIGNLKHNVRTRKQMIQEQRALWLAERNQWDSLLSDEQVAIWDARDARIRELNQRIDALGEGASRVRDGSDELKEAGKAARSKAARLRAERDQIQAMQSDSPHVLRKRVAELDDQLKRSDRVLKKKINKKRLGENDVALPDGSTAKGAFAGIYGDTWRKQAGSEQTWTQGMIDYEGRQHRSIMNEGNWEVIVPTEANEVQHLTAWADVLNNQFRQSKVAMHFIEGGDAQSFARWLKEPAQADLRERLPHYANDPEDWGNRVEQMVDQYAGTEAIRNGLREGTLTPERLRELWPDQVTRPSVHGATVAHNVGHGRGARSAGKAFNWMFKHLSETPTDKLSRHPYFAAVYKSEVNDLYVAARAQKDRAGEMWTDADLRSLENIARKRALKSLKQTLFDIEAHSGAAHWARFVSPFFAAHQEAMQRWWRIISEDPSVTRRIVQTFDMPRKLGIVVDRETGEPVGMGEVVSPNHDVMLRIPAHLGGNSGFGKWFNEHTAGWVFNENSMNLILQSGTPLNPGVGPAVTVPAEALLHKLSDHKELERVVRLMNPYPSENAIDQLVPATVRRLTTLIRGEQSGEFMRMWQTNFDDRLVTFLDSSNGRWPTIEEQEQLWTQTKDETQLETVFRFFQNFASPFPARPQSRFAAMQAGWQKLREQSDSNGKGYEWAIAQFKEKYGEAYTSLIQSESNYMGGVPATNKAVASLDRHRGLLNLIDPRLHGAVVGPEGAYDNDDEWSPAAARHLRHTPVKSGSSETYLSYDDPEAAFQANAIRQGWSEYSNVTDALNAMASDQGLVSWRDSEELTDIRDRAVLAMKDRNNIWAEDYDFSLSNPAAYDHTLADLERIASNRTLSNDPARMDIQHLKAYLNVRKTFAEALAIRAANGGASTMQAQANADLQQMFFQVVNSLEESNLDFQRFFVDPVIGTDPFLRTDDPALAASIG